MMTTLIARRTLTAGFAALVACSLALFGLLGPAGPGDEAVSFIVQGHDLASAATAVRGVGGTVTHELGIIHAVGAELTPTQVRALRAAPDAPRVLDDSRVEVAKKKVTITIPDTGYPTRVGANLLHDQGITGAGVTVAVLDTGWDNSGRPAMTPTASGAS